MTILQSQQLPQHFVEDNENNLLTIKPMLSGIYSPTMVSNIGDILLGYQVPDMILTQ